MKTQIIGNHAEALAEEYLKKQGLLIRERNYRCKVGEIDIIAQDRKEGIIFVEVRYRHSKDYGSAAETVTPPKQHKIMRTAEYYLNMNNLFEKVPCRFDVIAIDYTEKEDNIEWIKDAFQD
jgi:putative endonuclease